MAVALALSLPMVAACDTVQSGNLAVMQSTGFTPAQNLYRAHGVYNAALGGFVVYAESQYASPGIVASGTAINRQVKPAFEYAEAVIACAGPSASGSLVIRVANARCKLLDLSPQALSKNAGILSGAKNRLLDLLKNGS
jgi:hypothetical protein